MYYLYSNFTPILQELRDNLEGDFNPIFVSAETIGTDTTITFSRDLTSTELQYLDEEVSDMRADNITDREQESQAPVSNSDLMAYSTKEKTNLFSIHNSGRFYLNRNRAWVTDSDDIYGVRFFQFGEQAGRGSSPVVGWEHQGFLVKKGQTIIEFVMSGRSNTGQVTDLEFALIFKRPNPISRWSTGIDNDREDFHELMTPQFKFKDAVSDTEGQPNYAGDMNDTHRFIKEINYICPEDGFISIYVRPEGNLSSRRFFPCSYCWEVQYGS